MLEITLKGPQLKEEQISTAKELMKSHRRSFDLG